MFSESNRSGSMSSIRNRCSRMAVARPTSKRAMSGSSIWITPEESGRHSSLPSARHREIQSKVASVSPVAAATAARAT
ncbi:hypothetical protein ACFPRL_29250 [Pseudoclavibacter helvolus]